MRLVPGRSAQVANGPLAGKHAVVTGGGKGIGAAITLALSAAGASLTVMGRDSKSLESIATEIEAQPITVDLTDENAAQQAFVDAAKLGGTVDILVNNVGAAESAPLEKTSRDIWDRMIALNMTVAYTCSLHVLRGMKAQSYGRIINIASTASLKGYPYVAAYCAAKHGLLGFTRALATETIRSGITVNAVCPGFTETDLLTRSVQTIMNVTGRSAEKAREDLMRSNPQGRFILPEEVAASVLWLCSTEAQSVTGQAIAIDGGETQ
jgi:NAD(P)-dependent dehydrogenase (short-subunit alcohol dehydrogenase family)